MTMNPEIRFGSNVLLPQDPTSELHAATRHYVDQAIQGVVSGTAMCADAFTAGSQAAMLALSDAVKGDLCLRTDLNATYVLTSDAASAYATAANWSKLLTEVQSVAGRSGAVTLTSADISGLGSAAAKNTGTADGNVPVLGANGKLPYSMIPAVAITNTFTAESQTAMLALSGAEIGDVCVRTDLNKSYILTSDAANAYATLANWRELLTPTDVVQSVAGRTGAIVLTTADIGGLGAAATKDTGTASGNVPVLGTGGKLGLALIPTASTITNSTTTVPLTSAVNTHTSSTTVHVPSAGTTGNILVKTASGNSWGTLAYSSLTGVPETFTPAAHTHSIYATKFSQTLTTNGTTSSFTITHNLGSKDLVVSVLVNDVYTLVAWEATSTNAIQMEFAVAPATTDVVRVTVLGMAD